VEPTLMIPRQVGAKEGTMLALVGLLTRWGAFRATPWSMEPTLKFPRQVGAMEGAMLALVGLLTKWGAL